MCGILGYISQQVISETSFQQPNHALKHRGPNASGFFWNEAKTVALAHNRLSIIDLSTAANQPFFSACGRYVMVYNGELYNYQELKQCYQLTTRTTSDTEIIIEGFAKLGTAIFEQLNGMFAFAIYDKQTQQLFLCRDRLGIKPLFIYKDKQQIIFASELKAITAIKNLDFSLNYTAIPEFLHLGFIPQPKTIYQNIHKFPTAHYAIINTKNISNCTYYSYWTYNKALQQNQITELKQAKKQLKELLYKSVEQQLISDVPIGTFLSGGIDSSLVTAIASKIKKNHINTFSIGFDALEKDESKYAQKIATYLNTNHHPFLVKEQDAIEQLHNIIHAYDEPYADSSCFPSLLVSKLAKQHVTVALSGDGGDELFMGYGAYIWAKRLQHPLLQLAKMQIHTISKAIPNNRVKRAGNLFNYQNKKHLFSHIFSQEQYFFSENELQHLLIAPQFNFDTINSIELNNPTTKLSGAEQQSIWDMQHYLKDDLLVKMDRASMQHSLEVRVPILDNSIVDFSLSIPEEFKIHQQTQKYILKDVLYDFVPKHFFDRPKQGFAIPLNRWLHQEWHFLIQQYLSKSIIEKYNIVSYPVVKNLINRFNKNEDYLYNRIWVLVLLHWWLEEHTT